MGDVQSRRTATIYIYHRLPWHGDCGTLDSTELVLAHTSTFLTGSAFGARRVGIPAASAAHCPGAEIEVVYPCGKTVPARLTLRCGQWYVRTQGVSA
jgi:hypothetical protein